MNVKRRIAERRERNRQLAMEDAKRRCSECRIVLPKVGVRIVIGVSGRTFQYCSDECEKQAAERDFAERSR